MATRIRLPWKLERLPEAVPLALAAFLLATGVAKVFSPNYLCDNRFAAANALLMPVEIGCAALLRHPGDGRRVAALMLALLMPCAAAFLTFAHVRGYDVKSCGCFGPVEIPYWAHMVVCPAVFAAASAVLLREEAREAPAGNRNPDSGVRVDPS